MDKDKLVELLAERCEKDASRNLNAAYNSGTVDFPDHIDRGLKFLERAAALRSHAQPK